MVGSRNKVTANKDGEAIVFLQEDYRIPPVEAVDASRRYGCNSSGG